MQLLDEHINLIYGNITYNFKTLVWNFVYLYFVYIYIYFIYKTIIDAPKTYFNFIYLLIENSKITTNNFSVDFPPPHEKKKYVK